MFWSTSKLFSAHFELEDGGPDDRCSGRSSSVANGAVPSSTWWWTSGELIYKLQHTDRSNGGLHGAYPSCRKVDQVTKLPEKATTEEGSRDSAWWFEEIRRRSSSPEVWIKTAKVGAPPRYLRRSNRSPEREEPAKLQWPEMGVGWVGEREREWREKLDKIWYILFFFFL